MLRLKRVEDSLSKGLEREVRRGDPQLPWVFRPCTAPSPGEGQGRILGHRQPAFSSPPSPSGQHSQALGGPALSGGVAVSEMKETLESTHSADEDTETQRWHESYS